MNKKIYLAGGISGYTYEEAQHWRRQVQNALQPQIDCYSPLRNKDFLKKEGVITKSYEYNCLSKARGILRRDHYDCTTADLVFVNFLNAKEKSLGTAMEIAWAYDHHIPLVIAMETEGNLHDHPMITEAAGFRVESLDEAISVICSILLPG